MNNPSKNQDSNEQSYSFLRDAEEHKEVEINYEELIDLTKKNLGNQEGEDQNIVFYCQDCHKNVEVQKKAGKGISFACKTCGSSKIYYGTAQGVEDFFKRKNDR